MSPARPSHPTHPSSPLSPCPAPAPAQPLLPALLPPRLCLELIPGVINYQFTSNLKFIIHFSHMLPKVLLRGRDKGEPGSSHAAAEEIMGSSVITLKTINGAEISTRSGIQPAWPHPAASTPAPRGKRSHGDASKGVGGIWPG